MNALNRIARLGAAVGMSALVLTACGSSSGKSSSGESSNAAPSASQSSSAGSNPTSSPTQETTGSGGAKPGSSSGAVNLPLTATVRSALRDAYLMHAMQEYPKEKQANLTGPSSAHYGKVNGRYYAIGEIGFTDNALSRQDGPHVWRSPNGQDWEYVGDTGGKVCGPVPRALVEKWGVNCG
ncbi:hypothetical protein [Actinomadura gamaensis]|uniref:Uncharacterized protein n=1 Tax=Actinomadura gamaensis TaxID=1763541 RepID=A0ABV9U8Y2_9ACTN